ncbi:putative alcohol dehydrogenase [Helianthus anomalus]
MQQMDAKEETNVHSGKEIKCIAAVAWGPGQPFSIHQIRVKPPQKFDVRIKIIFTSICHTDLSAWQGEVRIYVCN